MKKRITIDTLNRPAIIELPFTSLWVFTALLLAALFVICLLAQPIADDYYSLAYIPHQTALHYIHHSYTRENGRFASAIVMVYGIKLFGIHAIKVVPALEIVALAAASTCLVWQIIKDRPRSLRQATLLGSAFTGVVLLVVPSIFDTNAWYASNINYVPALIGSISIAAMYLYLYQHSRRPWSLYISFALLVFVSQGFIEPTAAVTCLAASLLLIREIIAKRKTLMLTVTLWASAAAGLAAVYFAPGTQHREQKQHSVLNFHAVFIDSLRDFTYTKSTLFSWRIALILTLGIAFALLIPTLSRRARVWYATIGLALCIVPTYITGMATQFSGGTYMSPTRTATVSISFLTIGLLLIIVSFVHATKLYLSRWLQIFLYTVMIVGIVASTLPILTVVKAETLRDSLIRYRVASISEQLSAHQQTIYVIPAPILLTDSQAIDVSYKSNQDAWFIKAFSDYSGLQGHTIHIISKPPAGYCLTDSDAAWWGAYTCQADVTLLK